ncbi:MAG: YebC/PmpR family DNA-binding transcriptional regulator [Candidatus Omnitrophica bacterium]|nr:YebC/PmpR family DNA-binding transcriptional regulator [Candidatus Omnitrophota bacterium]MBU2044416.1 YebC/PmpR family DNA-binding transcriptional regulator [Candidatus Omnitrophota bacterium]MBU2251376.1 YebC/PmpR family DNA-binding transcriptional regulator [Candidatus Omnitrophota bacterium]MBU2473744.1 YebC/PmpR family DNA-binding transcriptional regulator [Candidatus Omnitrophota bacterium]
MSGHSKWASIKHKKGAADAKRGRLFTKLIREITVAAKSGGGNSDTNPSLRTAVSRAQAANMPKDNIEKAIKKGTGELPGVNYESCVFEGYGPGGVAIIVDVLTDNKNRASAEIRNIFTKRGANMAGAGSVAWIFTSKGYILIDKEVISEEELFSLCIDAGAEDIKAADKSFEVYCDPKDFEKVKAALEAKKITWEEADLTKVPNSTVRVGGPEAKQLLSLVESLEDHDDVQKVYANFDIPDDVLEKIAQEI